MYICGCWRKFRHNANVVLYNVFEFDFLGGRFIPTAFFKTIWKMFEDDIFTYEYWHGYKWNDCNVCVNADETIIYENKNGLAKYKVAEYVDGWYYGTGVEFGAKYDYLGEYKPCSKSLSKYRCNTKEQAIEKAIQEIVDSFIFHRIPIPEIVQNLREPQQPKIIQLSLF